MTGQETVEHELELMGLLERAARLYRQRPVEQQTIVEYCERLIDLPAELVRMALDRLVVKCEWFPSLAQIRGEAVDCVWQPPTWVAAWEEVRRQIRKVGHSGRPEFSSPLIGQIVTAMGWRAICLSEEPDRIAERFGREYSASVRRTREDAMVSIRVVAALQGGEPPQRLPMP